MRRQMTQTPAVTAPQAAVQGVAPRDAAPATCGCGCCCRCGGWPAAVPGPQCAAVRHRRPRAGCTRARAVEAAQ